MVSGKSFLPSIPYYYAENSSETKLTLTILSEQHSLTYQKLLILSIMTFGYQVRQLRF